MLASTGAKTVGTKRAAEILGVSRDTVIRYLEEGKLEGWRIEPRGFWRIFTDSIDRLKQRLSQT